MNTVSAYAIAGMTCTAIICFALPVFGFIWSQKKYGKAAKPFFVGVLAFVVSQVLIRIPIIQLLLPRYAWYTLFAQTHYNLYLVFLGLTAGIFEETARYLAVRYILRNKRRYGDAIAFGYGHGGIEAVVIVGFTMINYLVYAIAINNGSFETLLSEATQAQRNYIRTVLSDLNFLSALTGGIERILTVGIHIGMTMIVFRGFAVGRAGLYLLAAIAVHAFVDIFCVMLPQLGITGYAIEAFIAVFSAALIIYAVWAKQHTKWYVVQEGEKE